MINATRQLFEVLLKNAGMANDTSTHIAQVIVIALLLFVGCMLAWCFRKFVSPIMLKLVDKTGTKWDDYLINKPVLDAASHLFPCLFVYALLPLCYDNVDTATTYHIISRLLQVYITICSTFLITTFLRNLSLALSEQFEEHHLTGILQFLRMLIVCMATIVGVSLLFGYNPIRVVAGLGAAATVLLLVFKDSILGLVAGIQLSLNKMLKVGDWITIKKLDIDGVVEEISLTTIKVRNFDNTISTIPPYTLVSDTFQNWRGMVLSGARRVKRTLYVDVQSIRMLSVDEMKILNQNNMLADEDNDGSMRINLTLFRHYLSKRFKHEDDVVQDQWILFRQLNPTPTGLPLEVWFYTSATSFVHYEDVAASKVEMIMALLPMFHLRLFQSLTSSDIKSL